MRNRRPFRSHARRTTRRVCHSTVRARWQSPDDLGEALTAFRQAIRAHHRLARLAPRFFDSAVVERERREREARKRWMDLWEPALAKVYGCEPEPYDPASDLPPLPPLRTQRAVDPKLAACELWLRAGSVALKRHHRRHPHALPSWTQLARLLDIAIQLARLATGVDAGPEDPELNNYDSFWADLKRAYGHQGDQPSSAPIPQSETPTPQPAPPQSNAPAPAPSPVGSPSASKMGGDDRKPDEGNLGKEGAGVPIAEKESGSEPATQAANSSENSLGATSVGALAPAPQPGPQRRDAWSSWARQQRRLKR